MSPLSTSNNVPDLRVAYAEFLGEPLVRYARSRGQTNVTYDTVGKLRCAFLLATSLLTATSTFLISVERIVRIRALEQMRASYTRWVIAFVQRVWLRPSSVTQKKCEPVRFDPYSSDEQRSVSKTVTMRCPHPTCAKLQTMQRYRAVLVDLRPKAINRGRRLAPKLAASFSTYKMFLVHGNQSFLWAGAPDVCASRGALI
jgi:hypothetical protein